MEEQGHPRQDRRGAPLAPHPAGHPQLVAEHDSMEVSSRLFFGVDKRAPEPRRHARKEKSSDDAKLTRTGPIERQRGVDRRRPKGNRRTHPGANHPFKLIVKAEARHQAITTREKSALDRQHVRNGFEGGRPGIAQPAEGLRAQLARHGVLLPKLAKPGTRVLHRGRSRPGGQIGDGQVEGKRWVFARRRSGRGRSRVARNVKERGPVVQSIQETVGNSRGARCSQSRGRPSTARDA